MTTNDPRPYEITGLQATEPDQLDERGDCRFYIVGTDSQGFDEVTVAGPTREAVLDYVRHHWGDDDPEWFAEYVEARVEQPCADCGRVFTMYPATAETSDGEEPAGWADRCPVCSAITLDAPEGIARLVKLAEPNGMYTAQAREMLYDHYGMNDQDRADYLQATRRP